MWTSVRDGDDARALRADHAQPNGAPCSVIAIPEHGPVRNVLHARSHQFGFLPHFQSGLSWHDAAWAGARRAAHVARSSATLAAWRSCLVRPRLHRQRSGIVRGSLRSDKHRPVLKAHRPRTPPVCSSSGWGLSCPPVTIDDAGSWCGQLGLGDRDRKRLGWPVTKRVWRWLWGLSGRLVAMR